MPYVNLPYPLPKPTFEPETWLNLSPIAPEELTSPQPLGSAINFGKMLSDLLSLAPAETTIGMPGIQFIPETVAYWPRVARQNLKLVDDLLGRLFPKFAQPEYKDLPAALLPHIPRIGGAYTSASKPVQSMPELLTMFAKNIDNPLVQNLAKFVPLEDLYRAFSNRGLMALPYRTLYEINPSGIADILSHEYTHLGQYLKEPKLVSDLQKLLFNPYDTRLDRTMKQLLMENVFSEFKVPLTDVKYETQASDIGKYIRNMLGEGKLVNLKPDLMKFLMNEPPTAQELKLAKEWPTITLKSREKEFKIDFDKLINFHNLPTEIKEGILNGTIVIP